MNHYEQQRSVSVEEEIRRSVDQLMQSSPLKRVTVVQDDDGYFYLSLGDSHTMAGLNNAFKDNKPFDYIKRCKRYNDWVAAKQAAGEINSVLRQHLIDRVLQIITTERKDARKTAQK